jgi:hypothetical protein
MKSLRYLVVMVGAVSITALGLDAADTWRGSTGTLLSQLIGSHADEGCLEGMVPVAVGQTFRCIDRYEASTAADCTIKDPAGPRDTETNLMTTDCRPVSEVGRLPWRFVAREDAARLCTRAGKRLPSADEWYTAALDTPDEPCLRGGTLRSAGTVSTCLSPHGAYDLVGNVWEWVADDVIDGMWEGRLLPETGYVTQVDRAGIATVTSSSTANRALDHAYFWSQTSGAYGMIRGGFYGSRADAGVVSVHAATPPSFTGEAVGFRCVK